MECWIESKPTASVETVEETYIEDLKVVNFSKYELPPCLKSDLSPPSFVFYPNLKKPLRERLGSAFAFTGRVPKRSGPTNFRSSIRVECWIESKPIASVETVEETYIEDLKVGNFSKNVPPPRLKSDLSPPDFVLYPNLKKPLRKGLGSVFAFTGRVPKRCGPTNFRSSIRMECWIESKPTASVETVEETYIGIQAHRVSGDGGGDLY
ncbi:hypothetical protein QE152_g22910 [Popillia japonica]|uniref:Uncharacterized protein n=1 Tax=Popillia japonica TaxID=7064 RepID=A0AAW1KIG0_POPJA